MTTAARPDDNGTATPAVGIPLDRRVGRLVPERSNPWGLTAAEARVMNAICTHGCHKTAASVLCRSLKTIEVHSSNAGQKMPQRTSIGRYLAWDRWMRQDAAEAVHKACEEALAGANEAASRGEWDDGYREGVRACISVVLAALTPNVALTGLRRTEER